jgi:murein DD-endopeptidase MepM/ murein hydrolase activator NlpD
MTEKFRAVFWPALILLFMSAGAASGQVAGEAVPGVVDPVVNMYPMTDQGQSAAGQGGVVLIEVRVKGAPLDSVSAKALGLTVPFYPTADFSRWVGLLGVDMNKEPGVYPVKVTLNQTNGRIIKKELNLTVLTRDFGVQHLTLPKEMEELDDETQVKVKDDNRAFAKIWSKTPSSRYFGSEFVRPVPGEKTSEFGVRRFINEVKKSPHAGVDYRAALGEPVRAIEAGQVVLVRECYFAGRAVVIDHGAGLYSMYFHFSEFKVEPGQLVQRGQEIGLAGSTGRATGPHLHFGLRLLGAKVDPESLFAITPLLKEMER